MINSELHIEGGTHKKGEQYPEHEWSGVTSYFNIMKASMDEHHQVFGTNEGIARQIDSVYSNNSDAIEARYFYMHLKEIIVKRRY
jgi:hypothetical protein